jgi:hypothetical protein
MEVDTIPTASAIHVYASNAYFSDCFSSVIPYENQSALDLFLLVARQTPTWIDFLMSTRNKVVSKLGLKDLGKLADIELRTASSEYDVGDRVGIFTLYKNTHYEVILEDRDKHLDVKVSVFIEPDGDTAKVSISTVVHVKNTFGKVYMFFVAPVHKIIVPATMKKLVRA